MITYGSAYSPGEVPVLAKSLTIGSESMSIKVTPISGKDELDLIPLDVLMSHLENLKNYIKDEATKLTVFNIDDLDVDFRFPFRGYKVIDEIAFESHQWWEYIYNHREPEEMETPA